jgi:hypothetical protein
MIAAMPDDAGPHICVIGGKAPVTLEFLVTDYLAHLQHHLEQILGD